MEDTNKQTSVRDQIIDMDVPREKSLLMNLIRGLSGKWKLSLVRDRRGRSNSQLNYYFAEVVSRFMDFMEEQGQFFNKEECHEFFKAKFIREPDPITDQRTGKKLGPGVRSTRKMSAAEMSVFIENVRMWLADTLDVITKDPSHIRD